MALRYSRSAIILTIMFDYQLPHGEMSSCPFHEDRCDGTFLFLSVIKSARDFFSCCPFLRFDWASLGRFQILVSKWPIGGRDVKVRREGGL